MRLVVIAAMAVLMIGQAAARDLGAPGPGILEPVARAFVDAARKIVERGEAAFR